MSTPATLLNDGVAALKQGDYATAIPSLKAFCESPIAPDSKAYLQAHKFLVQAYVKEEQHELALETCIKLAQSKVPTVQQWASEAIPVLENHLPQSPPQETVSRVKDQPLSLSNSDPELPDYPLESPVVPPVESPVEPPVDLPALATVDLAAAKGQINDAIQAFRQRDYAQVIELLEPLSHGLPPHVEDYGRVQMTLAKAYQADGQTEAARNLGQTMVESDRDDLKIWGAHFLNHLKHVPATQQTHPQVSQQVTPGADQLPEPEEPSAPSAQSRLNTSVSGIAYQPPAAPPPIPSQNQRTAQHGSAIAQPEYKRDPNDKTAVIQSALSHGAVTFLFSLLLYRFLPFFIAFPCDLLRWAVPVIIYCTATDPIAKENAKQATNYAITAIILLLIVVIGSVSLFASILAMELAWSQLLLLLTIPLGVYGWLLTLWPVAGTFICIANPDNTFHYPKWLVWRVLK